MNNQQHQQQQQQQQQEANQHEQEHEQQEEQEQEQQELPLQPWPGNSRPLNRATLSPQHQQRVNTFWQSQMQEILATTDFRNARLPISRVRRQMKSETNVPNVSSEATLLTTKACELLIGDLIHRAWLVTETAQRLIIRSADISSGVERADMYDFLVDVLPWAEPRPFCSNRLLMDHENGEGRRRRRDNNLSNLMNYDNNNNLGGGFGTSAQEYYNNWGVMTGTNVMGAGVYAPNYTNSWGNGTGTSISMPNYNNNNWGEGSSTGIGTSAPNYNKINWGDGTGISVPNNLGAIAAPNYFPPPQGPAEQNQENASQSWPGLSWLSQHMRSNDGTSGTNYFPVDQVPVENNVMNEFLSSYGGGGTGVPNYFPEPVQNNNTEASWVVSVSQGENNGDNVGMSWTSTTNWGLNEIFNTGTGGTSADNPVVVQELVQEQPVQGSNQVLEQGNRDSTQ